jgi:ACR3 family arsenite efflux pump ArsB
MSKQTATKKNTISWLADVVKKYLFYSHFSTFEDHQAVAMISVTKNQSVAAAMATAALGPQSALAPALIPIIQPVLTIAYLNAEDWIRRFLKS